MIAVENYEKPVNELGEGYKQNPSRLERGVEVNFGIYTYRVGGLQIKVIKTENKIDLIDRLKNRQLEEIYKYFRS